MSETTGRVVAMFVCLDRGLPMQEVSNVRAIKGFGLEGDRYALGRGSWSKVRQGEAVRHVTVIAQEAIDEANSLGEEVFLPADTRRNIVIAGVDPNTFADKVFAIGSVRMRWAEYCDPCVRPQKLRGRQGAALHAFENAFRLTAGIRAEILDDGEITVGDEIHVL